MRTARNEKGPDKYEMHANSSPLARNDREYGLEKRGGNKYPSRGMAARAAQLNDTGPSAGRNIAALGLSVDVETVFPRPRSSERGIDTPSVTTPYTDEGGTLFRRGGQSFTIPGPKFPSMSQLHSWGGENWTCVDRSFGLLGSAHISMVLANSHPIIRWIRIKQ